MESVHGQRKNEHLALAELNYKKNPPVSSLDAVRIIHRPLPETSQADVNLKVDNADFPWDYPFYIEAMTGGSAKTSEINTSLAAAAKATGVAMAVGSQSIAMKEPAQVAGFEAVRAANPNGFMMANIGAGHTVEHAQRAIEMLQANALEIHINAAQETVMPEGDTTFYWKDNIAKIKAAVDVPVIVKEVGFGMDAQSIAELADLGIEYVNIGGRSGTNFAEIEDRRNRENPYQYDFLYDWGQTTAESLLEAQLAPHHPTIMATGGIQSPLDILKAQVLGAETVGVAGHFLHTLLKDGEAGLIAEITLWQRQLRELYALVGAKNGSDLVHVPYVLSADLQNYLTQRR
ncbi:isopentenyl-diphosphate delta-isomerase [Weissella uvarum]|uniref:type 2 isopentenyl-diphosphate Delta-isomerase n=1 Tax=Weissella uvarum TaxID=1479233 RepID=UPI0019615046|nr:type 2 isopentenyl-diphosphate Delta-isomerase [Weissella uvarum]MBM7617464.1 isopentenyl-diphosphate delta-isomerase [Weissella uvarum]MCM0595651.1 type 2 isopentenyl-diphosphate Delta-isomerase [Weissella uvarum]